MKTRLLIIIGIVMMAIIPFVTFTVFDIYSDYVQHLYNIAEQEPNTLKPVDKYYIELERKSQLVAVEQDLRSKIAQLHQNSLTAYVVNLDYETKKIMVIVETEQFNSEIEEIISEYPDYMPIVFYNSKIELQDESESSLLPCTSDRTACFNTDANVCDPTGWECSNTEGVFEKIIENED